MSFSKRIYLYPIAQCMFEPGANDYILQVRACLSGPFEVINGPTQLGLLDMLRKLPKTDIIYFNWIDDLVDRRLGYLQLSLLLAILLWCRLRGKQVVWCVHNNTSHRRSNWWGKKLTERIMARFSDTILSHSRNAELARLVKRVAFFDHPLAHWRPVALALEPQWDLLIWGTISPYKGVQEFVRHHAADPLLRQRRVLVAGRFSSEALYREVAAHAHPNVTLRNEVLSEEDLEALMGQCHNVLFCYNSPSVLSSGALSKTLSFGKTIIGPAIGSFQELGARGLIHTYRSFGELGALLEQLDGTHIDPQELRQYTEAHSWPRFGAFLQGLLKEPKRPEQVA
jgi:beta-1,4-mannosyltransferase